MWSIVGRRRSQRQLRDGSIFATVSYLAALSQTPTVAWERAQEGASARHSIMWATLARSWDAFGRMSSALAPRVRCDLLSVRARARPWRAHPSGCTVGGCPTAGVRRRWVHRRRASNASRWLRRRWRAAAQPPARCWRGGGCGRGGRMPVAPAVDVCGGDGESAPARKATSTAELGGASNAQVAAARPGRPNRHENRAIKSCVSVARYIVLNNCLLVLAAGGGQDRD